MPKKKIRRFSATITIEEEIDISLLQSPLRTQRRFIFQAEEEFEIAEAHVGVNEDREADADLVEAKIGGGGVAANAALARKYEDVLKYWVVI